MGKIICEKHGENTIAFISKYHADNVFNNKKHIPSEIINIHVIDKQNAFNGNYIIDPILIKDIGIRDFKINFQTEFGKYEKMFDTLTPVCSKCWRSYKTT